MRIGATFPQTEIGSDAGGVRDYAQAVEAMGFTHILAYDHVLGADLTNRPDFQGPYNLDSGFHEPFVMYGYLAGLTKTIELTYHHPSPAPDGARSQTSRCVGRAIRRPAAAWDRPRLERSRI